MTGPYHEWVTNIKYAIVSLTMMRREWCFPLSERFGTSSLDTSRIRRERWAVTTHQFFGAVVVITPLQENIAYLLPAFSKVPLGFAL